MALPLVFGRSRQVALKRLFRVRLFLAAGLWAVGLTILVAKVLGLEDYAIEAGAFITGGLLAVGLLATLAMWPSGLPVVLVDRSGRVRGDVVERAQPPTDMS